MWFHQAMVMNVGWWQWYSRLKHPEYHMSTGRCSIHNYGIYWEKESIFTG